MRITVVVMGVSGCGKSTVAQQLAQALGLDFVDGDDLHSASNVAKMRAGTPLIDADRWPTRSSRWPWLDRVGQRLADAQCSPAGVAMACSALRRSYRDRIRTAAPGVRFLLLDGSAALIGARLAQRSGHYMPADLLASQFAALERPAADEADVQTLSIDAAVPSLVEAAVRCCGRRTRIHSPQRGGVSGE
jgi:gluconokinase